MKKSTLILLLTLLPLSSFAQTLGDDSDSSSSNPSCIILKNNFKLGARDTKVDGEVSILQDFLKEQGYYEGSITGYYGSLTKKAVASFQKKKYSNVTEENIDTTLVPDASIRKQLISSASYPNAGLVFTGTGNIGKYTRAKIAYVSCHEEVSNDVAVVTQVKNNTISNPSQTTSSPSSDSRIGTDCPAVGSEVKIVKAGEIEPNLLAVVQRNGHTVKSGFQYAFYHPGAPHFTYTPINEVQAFEFFSPNESISGKLGAALGNYGSDIPSEVSLSQCPGDFRRDVIPRECITKIPTKSWNFYYKTDAAITHALVTQCNLGKNKRWYLNLKPSKNTVYNVGGHVVSNNNAPSVGNTAYLTSCKGDRPTGANLYGKNFPDAYPANDVWRYDEKNTSFACTWTCTFGTKKEGNGCVLDPDAKWYSPSF